MRKIHVYITPLEPRVRDGIWAKPYKEGVVLYLRDDGMWKPVKMVDTKGTISPYDDSLIDDSSGIKSVNATIDSGVGIPGITTSFVKGLLSMTFHNLRGNGITGIDVDEQYGDGSTNVVTIRTDQNPGGVQFHIRNGIYSNKTDNVNGKATIILKPDSAFNSQLSKTNTIYIIRHDFDLDGGSVTIPESCVLRFDGGSISNGTVVGNNTIVDADVTEIFGDNIIIGGTWSVPKIYDTWFYSNYKTFDNISQMNNPSMPVDVYIAKVLEITNYIWIPSNTNVWLSGKIKSAITSTSNMPMLVLSRKENITITGGEIIGNKETNNNEYAHTASVRGCKNITFKNVKFINAEGDGISIIGLTVEGSRIKTENCTISGCTIYNAGRCGISIIDAEKCLIENTLIDTVDKHAPKIGIDLEPNKDVAFPEHIEDVTIRNVTIRNCPNGVSVTNAFKDDGNYINNITFDGLDIVNNSTGYALSWAKVTNLLFKNCRFDINTSYSYAFNNQDVSSCVFENCDITCNTFIHILGTTFRNCKMVFSGTAFNYPGTNTFDSNKITALRLFENVSGNFTMVGNNITLSAGGLTLRTSHLPDKVVSGDIIENNTFTFTTPYNGIDCQYPTINTRIRNNIFNVTITGSSASRRVIILKNCTNWEIHDNIFNVRSNHKVFDVSASTGISMLRNIINLPDGYDQAVYTGINTKTSASNRQGDMMFDNGKPIWFNGTNWVDADGNAAT